MLHKLSKRQPLADDIVYEVVVDEPPSGLRVLPQPMANTGRAVPASKAVEAHGILSNSALGMHSISALSLGLEGPQRF